MSSWSTTFGLDMMSTWSAIPAATIWMEDPGYRPHGVRQRSRRFTASWPASDKLEQALQDNPLMTLDVAGTDHENLVKTQLRSSCRHSLAGLSGVVTASSDRILPGLPGAAAVRIAKIQTATTHSAMPETERCHRWPRRAGAGHVFTGWRLRSDADGHKLIDAAINWALRTEVVQLPVLTASLSGNQLTITWTNGGTLEKASAVTGPYITTNDSDGSYTETVGAGSAYFRVKR
jgi:hypothetical protein